MNAIKFENQRVQYKRLYQETQLNSESSKLLVLPAANLGETLRLIPGAHEYFNISDELERLGDPGNNGGEGEDGDDQADEENEEEAAPNEEDGDEINDETEEEDDDEDDEDENEEESYEELRRHYIDGLRLNPCPVCSRLDMLAQLQPLIGSRLPIVVTQRTHPTFEIGHFERYYVSGHEPLIGSDPAYQLWTRMRRAGYSTDQWPESTSQFGRMQMLPATPNPANPRRDAYIQTGAFGREIVYPPNGEVNRWNFYSPRGELTSTEYSPMVEYQRSDPNTENPPRNRFDYSGYRVGDTFLYSPPIPGSNLPASHQPDSVRSSNALQSYPSHREASAFAIVDPNNANPPGNCFDYSGYRVGDTFLYSPPIPGSNQPASHQPDSVRSSNALQSYPSHREASAFAIVDPNNANPPRNRFDYSGYRVGDTFLYSPPIPGSNQPASHQPDSVRSSNALQSYPSHREASAFAIVDPNNANPPRNRFDYSGYRVGDTFLYSPPIPESNQPASHQPNSVRSSNALQSYPSHREASSFAIVDPNNANPPRNRFDYGGLRVGDIFLHSPSIPGSYQPAPFRSDFVRSSNALQSYPSHRQASAFAIVDPNNANPPRNRFDYSGYRVGDTFLYSPPIPGSNQPASHQPDSVRSSNALQSYPSHREASAFAIVDPNNANPPRNRFDYSGYRVGDTFLYSPPIPGSNQPASHQPDSVRSSNALQSYPSHREASAFAIVDPNNANPPRNRFDYSGYRVGDTFLYSPPIPGSNQPASHQPDSVRSSNALQSYPSHREASAFAIVDPNNANPPRNRFDYSGYRVGDTFLYSPPIPGSNQPASHQPNSVRSSNALQSYPSHREASAFAIVDPNNANPPRNRFDYSGYRVGDTFLYSPSIPGSYQPAPFRSDFVRNALQSDPSYREARTRTSCICHHRNCPQFGAQFEAARPRRVLSSRQFNTYTPSGRLVPQSWYHALQHAALLRLLQFNTYTPSGRLVPQSWYHALQHAALLRTTPREQSANQYSPIRQDVARPHLHGPYEPLLAHRLANAVEYGLCTAEDDDDGQTTLLMNDVLDQIVRLRPELMEQPNDDNNEPINPLDEREANIREEQKMLWEVCKSRRNDK
ncbi:uncharacterized protein LOC108155844 isoform X2 [Drosophila miranda]|nr:uncharacterized protein LOC108155844 isoform X2 [Drosophila miranda]